jgi:hypothetical protein
VLSFCSAGLFLGNVACRWWRLLRWEAAEVALQSEMPAKVPNCRLGKTNQAMLKKGISQILPGILSVVRLQPHP